VTTTSDSVSPSDRGCSLRAAILAANTGTVRGYCVAGSAGRDRIVFALGSGTPLMKVASNLPEITDSVVINGATGGATRIHLDGPDLHGLGTSVGLRISGGSQSGIGGLFISDFGTGIDNETPGTVIVANVIEDNGYGITSAKSVTIGGSNTHANGDACTDSCNLISGNGDGILARPLADGVVSGNLIGTTADGKSADPNQLGITTVNAGTWTIGGATADLRNVVSGNVQTGMQLSGCICTIQGNYVGTDVDGTSALPNRDGGVWVEPSVDVTIGGLGDAGNIISGNVGVGLRVDRGSITDPGPPVLIEGNRVGVNRLGKPLGNSATGVALVKERNVTVGSSGTPEAANTIAYNGGNGLVIDGSSSVITVRENSIHDNLGGIFVVPGGNNGIPAPVIGSVKPISGTAMFLDSPIDIYSDKGDEGATYEGTTMTDSSGHWTYGGTVSGPNVTATVTDELGDTSAFSSPVALPVYRPDARVRKGIGPMMGDNVYNATGQGQTITGSVAPGKVVTFGISLQNDGATDAFIVSAFGAGGTPFSVRYSHGLTDITAMLSSPNGFITPQLASGKVFLITATVVVGAHAADRATVSRLVTIRSVTKPGRRDAVGFVVKRS
jgi:CSLREA domain-containing protein